MAVKKPKDLADFVRLVRKDLGYSQGDLGKILKYNAQMVSNVERRKNKVPKEFCRRLSKKIGWRKAQELSAWLKAAAIENTMDLLK